jgi:heme-degrading monooxygenase HmoA
MRCAAADDPEKTAAGAKNAENVTMHLAQINIGRMRAPLDDPSMQGFASRLAELNALADGCPGFVWRMQDGEGAGNTYLRPFDDDRIIVNMSVWESIEQLKAFTYGGPHAEVLKQRREWFEKFERVALALWWIRAGRVPTMDEAKARLESLEVNGPTPFAFTFKAVFPPDDVSV